MEQRSLRVENSEKDDLVIKAVFPTRHSFNDLCRRLLCEVHSTHQISTQDSWNTLAVELGWIGDGVYPRMIFSKQWICISFLGVSVSPPFNMDDHRFSISFEVLCIIPPYTLGPHFQDFASHHPGTFRACQLGTFLWVGLPPQNLADGTWKCLNLEKLEQAWTISTKTTSRLLSDFPCSYVRGCICTKNTPNKRKNGWLEDRPFISFDFGKAYQFSTKIPSGEFSMVVLWVFPKNRGVSPKMDGFFHGNPQLKNGWFGWKTSIFLGNPQKVMIGRWFSFWELPIFRGLFAVGFGASCPAGLAFQEISWLHRGTATEHELRGGLRRFSRCGFDGRHVGQVVHGLAGEKSFGLDGSGVIETRITGWWRLKDLWNFHPENWRNDPNWLIFFRWGWNHQLDNYINGRFFGGSTTR